MGFDGPWRGQPVVQADLTLELLPRLFSKPGLARIFAAAAIRAPSVGHESRRVIALPTASCRIGRYALPAISPFRKKARRVVRSAGRPWQAYFQGRLTAWS